MELGDQGVSQAWTAEPVWQQRLDLYNAEMASAKPGIEETIEGTG